MLKCRVTGVDAEPKCRLGLGDKAIMTRKLDPRSQGEAPRFTISFPEILAQSRVGAEVSVDDAIARELYAARANGARLDSVKGLNFPTEPALPPMPTRGFVVFKAIATLFLGFPKGLSSVNGPRQECVMKKGQRGRQIPDW